ncbi:site-2 protease family protein [Candidatus Uhrbacteria bacterium]|nr:site-2 protease family protein [Candidatus Uhrbacteria bacterium]
MIELISTIALFLVILSILVLIHEFGHFAAARFFGIAVEEFGLGFPPRAAIIKKGKQTTYTLNWLPFGGFVKLKGEQGDAATDPDSFAAKPIWKRIIVLGAGVFMNIAFTVLVFTVGFSFGMPQSIEGLSAGADVRDMRIQIIGVLPDTPADAGGMKAGDNIVRIDGSDFSSVSSIQEFVAARGGKELAIDIKRGEEMVTLHIAPTIRGDGDRATFGIELLAIGTVSYPLPIAFYEASRTTVVLVRAIFQSLGSAIRNLKFDGFVGPVGIAEHTAKAADLGFFYLLNLMALISLSLGIFNVLPIPALDGGRIVFVLIEGIRRRSIRPEVENAIHLIGFVILLGLLVLVTARDIGNLF